MTKQTLTVWRRGLQSVSRTLAQKIQKVTIGVALVGLFASGQAAQTVDPINVDVVEMTSSNSVYAKVILVQAVPGGSISLDLSSAFMAQYPEAIVDATLSGNGQTLAISIVNGSGPINGTWDVAVVNVNDDSGATTSTHFVRVADGVVEVDLGDY